MSDGVAGPSVATLIQPGEFVRGLRWKILLSVVGPIAWLIFTLLYVGFWAAGYSLFQDVVVILVSILVLIGVFVTSWVVWGVRRVPRWRRV